PAGPLKGLDTPARRRVDSIIHPRRLARGSGIIYAKNFVRKNLGRARRAPRARAAGAPLHRLPLGSRSHFAAGVRGLAAGGPPRAPAQPDLRDPGPKRS